MVESALNINLTPWRAVSARHGNWPMPEPPCRQPGGACVLYYSRGWHIAIILIATGTFYLVVCCDVLLYRLCNISHFYFIFWCLNDTAGNTEINGEMNRLRSERLLHIYSWETMYGSFHIMLGPRAPPSLINSRQLRRKTVGMLTILDQLKQWVEKSFCFTSQSRASKMKNTRTGGARRTLKLKSVQLCVLL